MYDRKTWVILALCGALLAANLYYTGQNKVAQDAIRAKEEALQKKVAPPTDVATATSADLTVDPPPPPTEEETVVLETKEVIFTLTNIGGGIKYAEFKNQFKVGSKTRLREDMVQLNHFGTGPIGGLAGPGETLENLAYTLKADESIKGKKAVFIAKLPSRLIAKKTFSLVESDKPGTPYLLNFELELENAATSALNLNQWSIFLGEASPNNLAEFPTYTGFLWHDGSGMNFKAGSSFKSGMISAAPDRISSPSDKTILYAGVTNQFFATVVRPDEPVVTSVWGKSTQVRLIENTAESTIESPSVRAGLRLPSSLLQPQQSKTIDYHIFVGPKDNTMLQKMDSDWGNDWGKVIDYGFFWWVSRPLNATLNFYHRALEGFSHNWSWGLAVIFLTITVRLLLWIPQSKSTRTMKRMAKLQPEMAKIKEKYADDPNKINTETMGLYRKYGINPLGGCLPMFIQIPVFWGFFAMLRCAVELRGHGFLWIHDLSQADTLYTFHLPFALPIIGTVFKLNVLPIVMAITSFFQMRMTPMTGDKTQQSIMRLMPLMFLAFCYNYASALALYCTTQNIFGIIQTYLMNRIPEPELKARTTSDKKSFVQRMVERQAEIQKAKANGGMRDVTPTDAKKKPRPPRTGG
jgi:YidC/Oxa1 family membrane protein insertase